MSNLELGIKVRFDAKEGAVGLDSTTAKLKGVGDAAADAGAKGSSGLGAIGNGAGKASAAVDHLGMSAKATNAALRGIPAQFTDIVTSLQGGQAPLTVFLQQGGQLKDMFGGAGNAAKAMGGYVLGLVNPLTISAAAIGAVGYAYYQGANEAQAFTASLVVSGNAANTTAGQLMDMSRTVSASTGATRGAVAVTLNEIAASGKVSADVLALVGKAAIDMERAGGAAASETVKEFSALGDAPAAAVLKLNDKYHFLTASVYEQIKALHDQGRETDAAKLAQTTYADAIESRIPALVANIGTLEHAWTGVMNVAKLAWDSMFDVGRPSSLEEQLAAATRKLNGYVSERGNGNLGTKTTPGNAADQARVNALSNEIEARDQLLLIQRATNEADAAGIKTATETAKLREKYQTNAAKLEKDLADIAKSSLTTEEKKTAVIMARKQYEERSKDGSKNDTAQQYAAALAAEKDFAATQLKLIKARVAEGVESEEDGINEVLAAQIAGYTKEYALLTAQIAKTSDAGDKSRLGQQLAALGTGMQVAAAEYTSALAKIENAREKYMQSQVMGADNTAYKIEQENAALQAQIDVLGLTDKQLGEYEAAKVRAAAAAEYLDAANLREAASSMEAAGIVSDAIPYYRQLADAREAAGKALDQKGILEVEKGIKKTAVDAAAEWKKTSDKIGDNITDALMRGFESGKTLAENLRDAVVNMFKTMVLRPVVQATVMGGLSAIGMGSSSALTETASSVSSLGNIASLGQSAWGAYTGGIGSAYGAVASSGIGSALGLSTQMAAGYMAPVYGAGGTLLSAGTSTAAGGLTAAGSTIGMAIPYVGLAIAAAMAISSMMGKGGGPKTEGNYFGVLNGSGGSTAQQYSTWGNHGTGISGDSADGQLAQMAPSITKAMTGLIGSLGGSSAGVGIDYGYITDPRGTSEDQVSVAVSDAAGNIVYGNNYSVERGKASDALAIEFQRMTLASIKAAEGIKPIFKEIIAGIDLTTASAETLSQAISDVQGIVVLRAAFDNLNFGADALSLTIIKASGGVSALGTSLDSYYGNYFTEAERAAKSAAAVSSAFSDMGIALPSSKEAFRELVEQVVSTGDAGAGTFAQLMSLESAFSDMADAAAVAEKKLTDSRASLMSKFGATTTVEQATASVQASGLIEITGMDAEAIRSAMRTVISGATQTTLDTISDLLPAFDQVIQGLIDAADAAAAAADAAAAVADAVADAAAEAIVSAFSTKQALVSQYISDEQSLAAAKLNLSSEFAAIGRAVPKSKQEFLNLVVGIDQTTAAGQSLVASLSALSPTFNTVASAAETASQKWAASVVAAAEAANQVIIARQQKSASEASSLQAQWYQLMGSTIELRKAELAVLEQENQTLQKNIWAYQDAQAAVTAAASASDAALSAVQASVEAQKALDQTALTTAQTAEATIKGVFDTLKGEIENLYSQVSSTSTLAAASGNAFIAEALAAAQSSGALPDSAALSKAVASIDSGISAGASTFEADRARLILAGQLQQLQDIAGTKLTDSETALKAAQDQLTATEAIYKNAQDQLNTLRGVGMATLSVADAVEALQVAMTGEKTDRQKLADAAAGKSGALNSTESLGQYNPNYISDVTAWNALRLDMLQTVVAQMENSGVGSDPRSYAVQIAPLVAEIATLNSYDATTAAAAYNANYSAAVVSAAAAVVAAVGNGTSIASASSALSVAANMPSFAVGANYIPHDMTARVHEGEAIIPRAFNPWAGGKAANDDGVIAELRANRAELIEVRKQLGISNARLARIEAATNGNPDRPVLVEIAA